MQIETMNYKQAAAESAAALVRSGMVVGLGTGSTAIFATHRIAQLIHEGSLAEIVGIATSREVWKVALDLGIPIMDDSMPREIDLTIDGADEIDAKLNVIKGGGGALLREKIVAQASKRFVVVADDSKMSSRLGLKHSVPVEVLEFGWESQRRFLESLGATTSVRLKQDGSHFLTDSGNIILDCSFGSIADAQNLADAMAARAGIIEHGLFLGLATDLFVAGKDGIRHLHRK